MEDDASEPNPKKRLGVLIGGSGLIGGALMHYFKTKTDESTDVLSPNSKKLSLREPEDIRSYFRKYRPDFIINTAIASIDSDPMLSYEVNYLGAINLARAALTLGVPYIHFSSAVIMPNGEDLDEDNTLPLSPEMSNYAKSKLMAERTLKHMHETKGLDYTNIRLGVVYGKHDHKIQGFHRLFFSIMNQSMLVMLTKKGVRHSYTHAKKLPPFIDYILSNREEFSGKTYNFVDPEPVELADIILTIKSYLDLNIPKEIYIPYPLARFFRLFLEIVVKGFSRLGLEARMPGELMFLENFYTTQVLSPKRLLASSYREPHPETTVYSMLPEMIQYYLTRWEHLNLITSYNPEFFDPGKKAEEFLRNPVQLLENMQKCCTDQFTDFED
ncbi:MAG: SDR family oxidoreductase [Proteobacteria bacterium]|nr:SDR family oxidoreductase [Pseudomonadota bacterium]MBU1739287.1 SDR family oxidoreductase [Pseudomonadota bacterium]